jgi:hypothetical protein
MVILAPGIRGTMKKRKPTRAEIQRRLIKGFEEELQAALGLSQSQAKQIMKGDAVEGLPTGRSNDSNVVASKLRAAIVSSVGNIGKYYTKRTNIKTEDELKKVLEEMKGQREKLPAATRKVLKAVGAMLPRRGGPGRQPKLDSKQASRACDQIAVFIRQKHTLKEALQKVSEISPTVLGQKVGARTLQKAWNKRG